MASIFLLEILKICQKKKVKRSVCKSITLHQTQILKFCQLHMLQYLNQTNIIYESTAYLTLLHGLRGFGEVLLTN